MALARTRKGIAALVAGSVLAVGASLLAAEASTPSTQGDAGGVWTAPSPAPRPVVTPVRDAASGFVHPGVLVSADQLDFVAERLQERAEPWWSAWGAIQRSRYGQLTWQPRPVAEVDCGFYSNPDRGCTQETEDGIAAYTMALLWTFTGDQRYARKAAEIIDAWSAVLKRHTNINAPVQAGWTGASFARAAELLRHTDSGWSIQGVRRARQMFRQVYLPLVLGGISRYRAGNWELIMLDAAVGMSVFLDDRATFNKAVAKWRGRLPAYIYLSTDGPLPKSPPGEALSRQQVIEYWGGQTRFVDGFAQETCRDFLHTGWGLLAAAHVAETAWIQGLDLYAEARDRLTRALELHAGYELGNPVPPWVCGGHLKTGLMPSAEVAYNHYTTRVGLTMPRTGEAVRAARPAPPGVFYAWETLTHAENPR
ncbi:alginate lyase family protein [Micromonospora sp. NPDC003776]